MEQRGVVTQTDQAVQTVQANEIARMAIYGDIHLSSKNYGAHRDYPKESLHLFREITRITRERNVTHLVGTGDFTYGRFHTLEYRLEIEKELVEQYNLTNGNRYEIEGNHDKAGYGMTEYQYYLEKGYLKPSENLRLGNVNISMIDYGKEHTAEILEPGKENELNVIIAHNFFKFNDTNLANYGKAIALEEMPRWFGVDYLIVGHIHNQIAFEGLMVNDQNQGHRMMVHYPGCMMRPSYREGHMEDVGTIILLTIYDNGDMKYETIDIPLWDLDKSFNLDKKAIEKQKKEEKEARVDITDIVNELAGHERNVGNPEDIIKALEGFDVRYKDKAIELLKHGMAD